MLPAWPPPFAAVQAAFVTAVALLGTALIGWMVRRERRLRVQRQLARPEPGGC